MALRRQPATIAGNSGQQLVNVQANNNSNNNTLAAMSDTVLVIACGRSVQVGMHDAQVSSSLKNVLQRTLNMHGQEFELYDNCGNMLITDGDLKDAVAKSLTPLTATLSEASIHYIENRREELSQMQWKLLRDKVDSLSGKVDVLTRQLSQLADGLTSQQLTMQEADRKLQVEIEKSQDSAKEQTRQLGAQLADRVEAVAQILHSERNMREALKEGIGRQVQGVRDALEADRSTRRSEHESSKSLIEELRRSLVDESRNRENLEERFHQDLNTLQDRLDSLSRYQADSKQDIEHYMKTITAEANKELEDNTRQVLSLRAVVDKVQVEASTRLQKVEDRTTAIENRQGEQANRTSTQINQLWSKAHSLNTTIENVRLKDRAEKLNLNSVQEIADGLVSETTTNDRETTVSQQLPPARQYVSSAAGGSLHAPPQSTYSSASVPVTRVASQGAGPLVQGAKVVQTAGGSMILPAHQRVSVNYAPSQTSQGSNRGPSPRRLQQGY